MFKLFNRSKRLQRGFVGDSIQMLGDVKKSEAVMSVDEACKSLDQIETGIVLMRVERDRLRAENKALATTNRDLNLWVEDLKNQVEQMASQRKVYRGQKLYNPDNHKSPTIYLCARWNEWYVVRAQNEATPRMITSQDFETLYGSYVVMPRQNFNRKHIL